MTGSSRRNRRETKKMKSTLTIINSVLVAICGGLSFYTIYAMYSYHFLAFRYINVLLTTLLLGALVVSLILILLKRAKKITTTLLAIVLVVTFSIIFAFRSAINLGESLNKSTFYSEVEMSVVVPKDSSITSIDQVKTVEAPTSSDSENIAALIKQVKTDKGIDLQTTTVDSYQKAYTNLMEGSSQAMVLNSAYSSLLELQDKDFSSNLKTLYTYKVKKATKSSAVSTDKDSFNIYVSGIDTYGSISTVSRSDVNIIMTVNLKTHKILLTTTPRDSYVQIPDGGNNQYDKLTHAGIYGVDTSRKTLENLYGITIDYYVRLNFTSFLKLIDEIGGITVYNDQAFTSYTNKNYSFGVGNVTLNSEGALAFVRERYSLENGDNDRGKNQEKVISAIVNKLVSFNSLTKLSAIVSNLQDSIQTNMPLSDIMEIANSQLSSDDKFTVASQAVSGTGSTGQLTSYAMPSASLYMMQLNQDSIDKAKAAINATLNGN
ncbi:LCP family glycopolymer transferase CpsA [Streptococcus sciuri]|uniref:LCP family protein n=1 Tax=Streptococcus sciuri TaxID=2973939 RepID=A0ABT2F5D8_9STRE|nr:LCP family protein [Streptococcus sciuri]MCS4487696.1 LCP family protein [Streptococcus sciuri]